MHGYALDQAVVCRDIRVSDCSPYAEVLRLEDAYIPGNEVSSRQAHNVARHNVLNVN